MGDHFFYSEELQHENPWSSHIELPRLLFEMSKSDIMLKVERISFFQPVKGAWLLK